jgi:hypothetical protein
MKHWLERNVSDSMQCWREIKGRIVALEISSWRCSKQVGQSEKIRKGLFEIDMCFSYSDEDGETLQWCQGTVIRVLREKRTYVTIEIKWNKECLREGDRD